MRGCVRRHSLACSVVNTWYCSPSHRCQHAQQHEENPLRWCQHQAHSPRLEPPPTPPRRAHMRRRGLVCGVKHAVVLSNIGAQVIVVCGVHCRSTPSLRSAAAYPALGATQCELVVPHIVLTIKNGQIARGGGTCWVERVLHAADTVEEAGHRRV